MEKKGKGKGDFLEENNAMEGKFIISSKTIRYSKLELAWRMGITVAVIALICLSV